MPSQDTVTKEFRINNSFYALNGQSLFETFTGIEEKIATHHKTSLTAIGQHIMASNESFGVELKSTALKNTGFECTQLVLSVFFMVNPKTQNSGKKFFRIMSIDFTSGHTEENGKFNKPFANVSVLDREGSAHAFTRHDDCDPKVVKDFIIGSFALGGRETLLCNIATKDVAGAIETITGAKIVNPNGYEVYEVCPVRELPKVTQELLEALAKN